MDSNTYSTPPPDAPPEPTEDLAELAAAVNTLAAQDAPGLPDSVRAARLVAWRRLLDRQEGLWLGELAALDARGAVGELDQPAPSTASWLRSRLRMSASAGPTVPCARPGRCFVGPLLRRRRSGWWGDLAGSCSGGR